MSFLLSSEHHRRSILKVPLSLSLSPFLLLLLLLYFINFYYIFGLQVFMVGVVLVLTLTSLEVADTRVHQDGENMLITVREDSIAALIGK